jgi:hypothetical protein
MQINYSMLQQVVQTSYDCVLKIQNESFRKFYLTLTLCKL